METQDFLNGLDKLTFVKHEDKTFYTEEGFEIKYDLELMGGAISKYPIQFIFRIYKEGAYVKSWGCASNDDNIIANVWWQKKECAMSDLRYSKREKKTLENKRLFESLTQ